MDTCKDTTAPLNWEQVAKEAIMNLESFLEQGERLLARAKELRALLDDSGD